MSYSKKFIYLSLICLPIASSAEIILGSGQLTLTAMASGTYDSNLNSSANNTADYFATFSPTISYTREAAYLQSALSIGSDSDRYAEYKGYDRDSLRASASMAQPFGTIGNYSTSLTAGYSESYINDYTLPEKTLTKNSSIGLSASIATSERTTLSGSSNFSRNKGEGYGNQDQFGNSLQFRVNSLISNIYAYTSYAHQKTKSQGINALATALDQTTNTYMAGLGKSFESKLNISAGIGYSQIDRSRAETIDGEPSDGGMVVDASIDGPFLPVKYFPKTTSSLSFSYSESKTPGIGDAGGRSLTGSMSLGWACRDNTNIGIYANRRKSLTVDDRSYTNTSAGLSLSETLPAGVTLRLSSGYFWNTFSYSGGQTEGINSALSANYAIRDGKHWSLSAMYNFNETLKTSGTNSYEKHLVTLSVNYRY